MSYLADCYNAAHDIADDMQQIEDNFAYLKANFSAAAEPADPVAGMIWWDSDDNLLKVRNTLNNAWITIAQLSNIAATKLDDFTAPDDNTDLDASTTKHGLCPKGTNVGHFLDDTLNWTDIGKISNVIFSYATPEILDSVTGLYTCDWTMEDTVAGNVVTSKIVHFRFIKVPLVDELTIEARLWNRMGGIGGKTTVTVASTGVSKAVQSDASVTPTWYSETLDVSGMAPGTYSFTITISQTSGWDQAAFCSAITIFTT